MTIWIASRTESCYFNYKVEYLTVKNNHRLVLLLHILFNTLCYSCAEWRPHSPFPMQNGPNTELFLCRLETTRSFSSADFLVHRFLPLQVNLNTTVFLGRCCITQPFFNTGYPVHIFLKERNIKTYTKTEVSTEINMHSMFSSHTVQFK